MRLGAKILRADAKAVGLNPGFSILDPDDIEPIVAELIGTTDRARARAAQWAISRWKNALVAPAAAGKAAKTDDEVAPPRAFHRYDDTLRAYQAVDFDDLIALPIALLSSNGDVAAKWRERCGHLLIDEYQDTNPAQYRLLRLLTGERASFTAVGDDDQAIYGWRGASVDNLAQLPRDYPGAEGDQARAELPLDGAHPALGQRADRATIPKLHEKKLWSEHGHGDAIRVTPAADDEAEAEGVVRRLLAHRFEHRGKFSDYAILYRGNHQAKLFEQQLRAQNAPYEISGGPIVFRAHRDQGPRRLSSPHRERRRRPGVHPRGHDAEARHRRDDARPAGRQSPRRQARVSSARYSPSRRRRRFPRASARCSTRSAR